MKKIRLKENIFETEEFPRYHSNCASVETDTPLSGSDKPFAFTRRDAEAYCHLEISAPGSEGMGHMEFRLSARSVHRLSGKLDSDRLRHSFFL